MNGAPAGDGDVAGAPGIRLDLGAGKLVEAPFQHVVFGAGTLLSARLHDELLGTFPSDGVLRGSRRVAGGDKTYQVRMATLYLRGGWSPALAAMAEAWRLLARHLVDSDYRYELAGLLGLGRPRIELELRLTEYASGGWMSRHTDRPDKLFSQNIYFCPQWNEQWGGGLALYAGEHEAEPASTFMPGAGTSLAFARTDRSWHEVLPVSAGRHPPRRALLVHGYRSAD